jgi:hypothetical protein
MICRCQFLYHLKNDFLGEGFNVILALKESKQVIMAGNTKKLIL